MIKLKKETEKRRERERESRDLSFVVELEAVIGNDVVFFLLSKLRCCFVFFSGRE